MKHFTVTCLIALTAFSATVHAQTFESNPNGFETPLGMSDLSAIDSPATSTRDENFNRVEINRPSTGYSVTTVGNLINVETSGRNNTVVINAEQINTGNQSSTVDSNGTN